MMNVFSTFNHLSLKLEGGGGPNLTSNSYSEINNKSSIQSIICNILDMEATYVSA